MQMDAAHHSVHDTLHGDDNMSRREVGQMALKRFFEISAKWRLRRREAMTLLGTSTTSTYANWKNGLGKNIPRDTIERVGYIVDIDRVVGQTDGVDVIAWLKRFPRQGAYSYFERMTGGNVIDIYLCLQEIEAAHRARVGEPA